MSLFAEKLPSCVRNTALAGFLLAALLFVGCDRDGEFAVNRLFSNGVVLQQKSKMTISGTAVPGTGIKIKTDWDYGVYTTAGVDGRWSAVLATPMADNKRHSIVLSSGTYEQKLSDILIGEVWIAAGQSNMRMPLTGWGSDTVAGGREIVEHAHDSLMRFFTAKQQQSLDPMTSFVGKWQSLDKENAEMISATAYSFAKILRDSLNVPVGMVQSIYGGGLTRTWISGENLPMLKDYAEVKSQIDKCRADIGVYTAWLDSFPSQSIYGPDSEDLLRDISIYDSYVNLSLPDLTTWSKMNVPGYWEGRGLTGFNGVVWFMRSITIPESWVGKELRLVLGGIDDRDVTYVNQFFVGGYVRECQFSESRVYSIPAGIVQNCSLTIAIRVTDDRDNGGLVGCGADGPMRVELVGNEADYINIEGEWSYCVAGQIVDNKLYLFGMPDNKFANHPGTLLAVPAILPSVVYNGMVAPLQGFSAAGVIWHHGEADVLHKVERENMRDEFPLIVKTFRKAIGNDHLPFIVAQISPSLHHGCHGMSSGMVRLHQHEAVISLDDDVSLVSTLDLGLLASVRPPFKIEEGRRMARVALSKYYDYKGFIPNGPMPVEAVSNHRVVSVIIDNNDGLYIDPEKPSQFEVAGSDSIFYPAKALISPRGVSVFSHMVPNPIFVRYASGNCAEPSLWNSAGIPCPSFFFMADTAGMVD